MLRLRLVALVALAAPVLGGGCGGDSPPTDGLPKKTVGAGGLALTLSGDEALVAGAPVTWALTVSNEREEPMALDFRSGQQGDVVLTTDDGGEAYRWSEERGFTDALVEQEVGAGASVTFELAEEELDVEPGTYRLVATVVSDPAPPPLEQTVTVG